MSSKMLYGRPIPVARIVQGISDRECITLAWLEQTLTDWLTSGRSTAQHADVRKATIWCWIPRHRSGRTLDSLLSWPWKIALIENRRPDLIFSSFRPLVLHSNTMHTLSERGVRVQRLILRRTLKALRMVSLNIDGRAVETCLLAVPTAFDRWGEFRLTYSSRPPSLDQPRSISPCRHTTTGQAPHDRKHLDRHYRSLERGGRKSAELWSCPSGQLPSLGERGCRLATKSMEEE